MANEQRMRPRKRKKVCAFCVDKVTSIDYKDTAKLRRYLSERGKILLTDCYNLHPGRFLPGCYFSCYFPHGKV